MRTGTAEEAGWGWGLGRVKKMWIRVLTYIVTSERDSSTPGVVQFLRVSYLMASGRYGHVLCLRAPCFFLLRLNESCTKGNAHAFPTPVIVTSDSFNFFFFIRIITIF